MSLATWYLLALPLSFGLCFFGGFGISGLWSGLMVGATTTCVVQWVVLARLDWPAEAEKAQEVSGQKGLAASARE